MNIHRTTHDYGIWMHGTNLHSPTKIYIFCCAFNNNQYYSLHDEEAICTRTEMQYYWTWIGFGVCVCVPCQDQNKLPISVSVYCPLTFNFKTKISHLTRVVCRYRCNAGASKLTCCMDRVCVWEKREIERWRLFDCGPRAKSTFLVSCRDIDFSFSGIPLNAMGTSFVATCVPCRMWSSIV